MRPGVLVLLLLLPLPAGADDDQPYLVRDLPGVNVRDSIDFDEPNLWTTIGDTTWFAARTASGKTEIFRTDGTLAGTVQVTHGAVSPDVATGWFVGVVNGKLIYAGSGALFALDTAGGRPVRLADVVFVEHGTTAGDTLYFTGSATMMLREPWRTDGTPEGTAPIDMLPGQPGSLDSSPYPALLPAGERFVFLGETPKGRGVHGTDGTVASLTLLVPAGRPEFYTGDITRLVPLGDRVIFLRWGFTERPHELWATDGTAAGTAPIAQVRGFQPLATVGGQLYFSDDYDIWITDGTAAGTRRTDIHIFGTIHAGAVAGEDFYFFTSIHPETLYVTRGTQATTRAIMEVDHGIEHLPGDGFALGGRFFFRHDDGIHGMELWSTDGTTAELVLDINPGPRSGIDENAFPSVRPDGTALFTATSPGIGRELWITDGTAAGTRLLMNIAAEDPVHSSSPRSLGASEGRLFFVATIVEGEDATGVSDGTRDGTSAVPAGFERTIHGTAAAAGRYFFSPSAPDPFGLYATDGTVAGTVGLYAETVHPEPLPNGVLFLDRDDETIWFSDGTVAGTRMLPGIALPDATVPSILPAGELAWVSTPGRVWRTDGSDPGTIEIVPATSFTGEVYDAIHAGTAYFLLESGARLWRSDGTSAGTRVVKAFGAQMNSPAIVGTAGGLVYLSVAGALHRSDGTAAGTFALPVNAPCQGVDLGGTLVFTTATEVWRSDGTVTGTMKVATMPQAATCRNLAVRGGRAYFAGWDAAHGWEPWVTDGTPAGTKLLADIHPGTASSLPGEFTSAGARLFFSAESPRNGRELWAIGRNPGPARRRSVGAR